MPRFTPIQNGRQIYNFIHFDIYILNWVMEDKIQNCKRPSTALDSLPAVVVIS
jgi:hypothetical protein